MSFRTRLGTLTALAVGLTVALASLASYFVIHHQLFSQTDSTLRQQLASFVSIDANGNPAFNPRQAQLALNRSNGVVQVRGQNGDDVSDLFGLSPIPGQEPLPFSKAMASLGNGNTLFTTVDYRSQPYRVLAISAEFNTVPVVIQIAQPIGQIEHTLTDLRLILWLVTVAGIIVAVGLGYVIGRATMRPVVRLTGAAEHVAATQDLSSRIEEKGDDELARLARSFNAMLMALAASREQQAQLISDAGHELRTPLTSLRTNIEVLLRTRDLSEADRAELTSDVEAQLEELTTLIGDVVDLARHEEKQPEPIEVRLDTIVERAVERARRRAPSLVFETHITPGSVRAQPALLERAVLNVLDNAAKWSPPGAVVDVWLQRGAWWTLDIRDHGPGISAEDLPHVFDRFYRAQTARALPGSGLGLAIVHQVVTNHGGTVTASVPPVGGTLIHIELPIVAESEPDEVENPTPDHPVPDPEPRPAPLPVSS